MAVSFPPKALKAAVKAATRRLTGVMALLLSGGLGAALLSHHASDPSLNAAGPGSAANWLGLTGAVVSDLMLQVVGLASAWFVIMPAAWGVRLVMGSQLAVPWLRTMAMLAALACTAVGLAASPLAQFLALPGGTGGELLLLALRQAVNGASIAALALALALGVFGVLLALWACMLQQREWAGLWRRLLTTAHAVGTVGRALSCLGQRGITLVRHVFSGARSGKERALSEERPPVAPPLQNADEMPPHTEPLTAPFFEEGAAVAEPPPNRPPPATHSPPPTRNGRESLLPPLELLTLPTAPVKRTLDRNALADNARRLEAVLQDFGVKGRIVDIRPGPVVALYDLDPAPGVKTNRVIGLADDIARAMSALSVRIAVTPGASTIGIELPNAHRETVNCRELLASDQHRRHQGDLVLALGRDIGGAPVYVDLARMPHLLVAGTTGSGKSVAINTMICSLLYRATPKECRFIMIDPKMLELSVYDGIPHLLTPVVTDPRKAVTALKWAVKEMETRYRTMSQMGVRNVASYNQKLADAAKRGETLSRSVQTSFDPDSGQPMYEEQTLDMTPLPFIVVIVDEMADLMLVAGKDVEAAIQRLAQMARAAGIHLIMATQRPSVDVITGTIKANFPSRISFQVASKIDSRTILGEQGAEQLLGQGDMLHMAAGGRVSRAHGSFISDAEVEAVANHLRACSAPEYVPEVIEEDEDGTPGVLDAITGPRGGGDSANALFDQAAALIARERKASTSFIQRHLQIGYNRAASIIERMEKEGMVSKANAVGKRQVLLPPSQDYR